jgi:hypothetical protein
MVPEITPTCAENHPSEPHRLLKIWCGRAGRFREPRQNLVTMWRNEHTDPLVRIDSIRFLIEVGSGEFTRFPKYHNFEIISQWHVHLFDRI